MKELLESKHLYQRVEVDLSVFDPALTGLSEEVGRAAGVMGSGSYVTSQQAEGATRRRLDHQLCELANKEWTFPPDLPNVRVNPDQLDTRLSSIEIPCDSRYCGNERKVHNPWTQQGAWGGFSTHTAVSLSQQKIETIQTIAVIYQCQACRITPITFLVKREGLRLWLVGRSVIEPVEIPKFIPKAESKFYKRAIVSYNKQRNNAF